MSFIIYNVDWIYLACYEEVNALHFTGSHLTFYLRSKGYVQAKVGSRTTLGDHKVTGYMQEYSTKDVW